MKDSLGREINTLRISITDRCNFKCIYCKGSFIKEDRKEILSFEEILEIVEIFARLGINRIKITGGEPLIRRNVSFLLRELAKIKEIKDLSITTNGFYLLEKKEELFNCGIRRINVSLDTLKKERFKKITGSDSIEKVIKAIEESKDFFDLKVNVVLLKNFNIDEIYDFLEFSGKNNLIVRFIELMPAYENFQFWKENFISYSKILKRFKKIRFISQTGNTKFFSIEGIKAGFIPAVSEIFCTNCNKIRLDARGNLVLCLFEKPVLNLKNILSEKNRMKEILYRIIYYLKPETKNFTNLPMMNVVGG